MKTLALHLVFGAIFIGVASCRNSQNNTDHIQRSDSVWVDENRDNLDSPRPGLNQPDAMRIDSLQDSLLLENKL